MNNKLEKIKVIPWRWTDKGTHIEVYGYTTNGKRIIVNIKYFITLMVENINFNSEIPKQCNILDLIETTNSIYFKSTNICDIVRLRGDFNYFIFKDSSMLKNAKILKCENVSNIMSMLESYNINPYSVLTFKHYEPDDSDDSEYSKMLSINTKEFNIVSSSFDPLINNININICKSLLCHLHHDDDKIVFDMVFENNNIMESIKTKNFNNLDNTIDDICRYILFMDVDFFVPLFDPSFSDKDQLLFKKKLFLNLNYIEIQRIYKKFPLIFSDNCVTIKNFNISQLCQLWPTLKNIIVSSCNNLKITIDDLLYSENVDIVRNILSIIDPCFLKPKFSTFHPTYNQKTPSFFKHVYVYSYKKLFPQFLGKELNGDLLNIFYENIPISVSSELCFDLYNLLRFDNSKIYNFLANMSNDKRILFINDDYILSSCALRYKWLSKPTIYDFAVFFDNTSYMFIKNNKIKKSKLLFTKITTHNFSHTLFDDAIISFLQNNVPIDKNIFNKIPEVPKQYLLTLHKLLK